MAEETHERLIGRLATVLTGLRDIESLPRRLCEAARQMLSADGAAIVLTTPAGSRVQVCASDELSSQLVDIQDVVDQGPSIEAIVSGDVQIASFADQREDKWSLMYEQGAGLTFAGTVIGVPLLVDSHIIGALSAHRQSQQMPDDVRVGTFLGVALATALLQDPELGLDVSADPSAWPSQAQIHQATGMVVAQTGILPQDALALLKGQAFVQNSTLLDVAQQIIGRHINFRHFTIEGD